MRAGVSTIFTIGVFLILLAGCVVPNDTGTATGTGGTGGTAAVTTPLEAANPLVALPTAPPGIHGNLAALPSAPTSKSVSLNATLISAFGRNCLRVCG